MDVVSASPGAPAETYFQLAVCHAQLQDWSAADTALDLALEGNPLHLPATRLKAYVRFSTGRYPDALEWATKYLETRPEDGVALKISGLSRFMTGDAAGAQLDLERSAEQLPNDFDAHYFLGRVYFERSQLSRALDAFRKALAINPSSGKAQNHLGQTLEGLTRFEAAERAYRKAIEIERTNENSSEWPYYNLGSLLLAQGDAPQAIELLATALERNPSSAQTRIKLGAALSAASRYDEAIRHLRAVAAAEPDNPDAHYQLGRLLMKMGKREEAREHFKLFEALRKEP